MGDNKQFLSLLKPVRRQLIRERLLIEGQLLLVLLGVLALWLQLLAYFLVIPFLGRYFLIGAAVIVIVQLVHFFYHRPRYHNAALLFNQFVPDDRVMTAYSFLDHEGVLERLQLQDSIRQMKKYEAHVLKRKKIIIVKKWIVSSLLLCLGVIILHYIPNEKSELAEKKETDIKLVEKTKKELEKKIAKEKDHAVKKALQEAEKKLNEKKSAEEALQELAKQTKKLELKALKEKEKQKALQGWQNSLHETGLNELAQLLDQKDMEKIEEKLAQLNKQWKQLTEEQKASLSEFSGQQKQLTEKELAELAEAIKEALDSSDLATELADAKATLQQSGLSLQQQMTANGTPPSQLAFSAGSGSNSSGQPSSSNSSGQNSLGNKPSPSGDQVSGNGSAPSANGNGSGSGNDSGSGGGSGGNGTGSSSGNGMGGGAGLGQGSRDFLTIPERMEGEQQIETDSGQFGEGNAVQQTEGSGPVLKGTIRPYNEVFGEYEQSYRQSADRYKLPSELKEIVKNYFTNIDPGGE